MSFRFDSACVRLSSRRVARPRDQTRRRDELVAATHELVARKGLGEVRLLDVAKQAGLTPGAVLYYFQNGLDDLFFAAYERAIERFCLEREAAVAAAPDPLHALATALALGVPTGRDDEEIRLLYDFEAVAFRSPACADLMAGYVARQVEMYAGLLAGGADAGAFRLAGDPRRLARNLVALEDGHGVYVLTGHLAPAELRSLLFEQAALMVGATLPEAG
jgi:AcrR family transcriptional regulator